MYFYINKTKSYHTTKLSNGLTDFYQTYIRTLAQNLLLIQNKLNLNHSFRSGAMTPQTDRHVFYVELQKKIKPIITVFLQNTNNISLNFDSWIQIRHGLSNIASVVSIACQKTYEVNHGGLRFQSQFSGHVIHLESIVQHECLL